MTTLDLGVLPSTWEFYRWMSRGIDERDPFALSLGREFLWDAARHAPEFQNLLRRVRLS